MRYREFVQLLLGRGFTRVERDDRMLDVFPQEDREKGIELWEKWEDQKVKIIRVRLPYYIKKAKLFSLSKEEMQTMLIKNQKSQLDKYDIIAEGEKIFT